MHESYIVWSWLADRVRNSATQKELQIKDIDPNKIVIHELYTLTCLILGIVVANTDLKPIYSVQMQ